MKKLIPFLAIALLAFMPLVAKAQATPTITSISPSSITADSPATAITITGTNFETGAVARINGANLVTSVVSATQLIATVPAANLETAGTKSITAINPGGTASNAVTLTVTTLPNTGFGPEDEGNKFTLNAGILAAAGLALSALLFMAVKLRWER